MPAIRSPENANGRTRRASRCWAASSRPVVALVFNGDPFGTVRAFDADNGKILWSFNTGSGLHSGIVSYAINDKQYILVPSGWGSFASLIMPSVFPELAGLPSAATLIALSLD